MKKTAVVFFAFFVFYVKAYALSIPLFNMPPNNYKLFTHKEPVTQTETAQQQIENKNTVNVQISGIFKSGNQYFVLINHRVYKKGDEVEGYKIEKIESNSVTFIKNGKESIQTLNPMPSLIFFTDDTVSNDNKTKH